MTITRRRLLATSLSAAALAALGRARAADKVRPAAGGKQEAAPPKPMTLLVLGGTAFLGPAVVEAARARGHVVTLFNRGKTNPHLFPDVEKLVGDRDGKLDALRGRRWDAVIDDSGYVPRIVSMSAKLLAPSVERYLFVSSISAYPEDVKPGADETAPVQKLEDPKSEDVPKHYGALKAASERAAEAALPGRTIVVRPGLIVGPGDRSDRFTYWPLRLDRGGEVLAPGDGEDPVQVIDVRDLAAFMVSLVERRAKGTYNACGPAERLTMSGLVAACRPLAPEGTQVTWVPWPFLEAEKVSPWSDLPAWVPRQQEGSGFTSISNRKAIAAGLAFRPLGQTARDTLAWWKAEPEERRAKPLAAGLAPEREKALLEKWRAAKG